MPEPVRDTKEAIIQWVAMVIYVVVLVGSAFVSYLFARNFGDAGLIAAVLFFVAVLFISTIFMRRVVADRLFR